MLSSLSRLRLGSGDGLADLLAARVCFVGAGDGFGPCPPAKAR